MLQCLNIQQQCRSGSPLKEHKTNSQQFHNSVCSMSLGFPHGLLAWHACTVRSLICSLGHTADVRLSTLTVKAWWRLPNLESRALTGLLDVADLDADQVSCDPLCGWRQHRGDHQWHRALPEGHEPQDQGYAARPRGQRLLGLLGQPHRPEGAQAQVLPGLAPSRGLLETTLLHDVTVSEYVTCDKSV